MTKVRACVGFAVAFQCIGVPAVAAATAFEDDFLFAHEQIASTYAYFDAKATRWRDIPALYRADIAGVTNKESFVRVMEHIVEELYDHHAHLTVNTATSSRLIPSQSDLWAEWQDERAIITEVRGGSDAARAEIHPGDELVGVNGAPIEAAVDNRMGRSYSHSEAKARDWALRAVLAGTHNDPRNLLLVSRGVRRTVTLTGRDVFPRPVHTPLTASLLPANIGLIRFNDGVWRGWVELVAPRGPFQFRMPVAVLVSHWTGSMGEGLAMGFDAAIGAKIVGTPMAGLLGATYTIKLPKTGIGINVPAERLYHVSGVPREAFVPTILVDLKTSTTGEDPVLEAALEALKK